MHVQSGSVRSKYLYGFCLKGHDNCLISSAPSRIFVNVRYGFWLHPLHFPCLAIPNIKKDSLLKCTRNQTTDMSLLNAGYLRPNLFKNEYGPTQNKTKTLPKKLRRPHIKMKMTSDKKKAC